MINTTNRYLRYLKITLIGVVCLTSLGVQAADNKPVVVNNDAANPVPVTITSGMIYRYIGNTTAVTLPSIGLNKLNDLCRADYGNEARMCSTKEYFETPDTTANAAGAAWVNPHIVTSVVSPINNDILLIDWTGARGTSTRLSCSQWTSDNGSHTATTISNDGVPTGTKFVETDDGCTVSRQIVCCTPQ